MYRLCPNQMVTANDDDVELEDNMKEVFIEYHFYPGFQ